MVRVCRIVVTVHDVNFHYKALMDVAPVFFLLLRTLVMPNFRMSQELFT